jgi:hypothetical protein
VLASVRELSRLELIGETLRAALNEIASKDSKWLKNVILPIWHTYYNKRVESNRLPRGEKERENYALTVGKHGFWLLTLLEAPTTPESLSKLTKVNALRTAWSRHYELDVSPAGGPPNIRFKTNLEVAKAQEQIDSPYDSDVRYRSKSGMHWTGYMVHMSETCDDDNIHLITHVHTTAADVHEAMCTETIHQALVAKGLSPDQHLVDAAYVSAELLVNSQADHGIDLIGPPRGNPAWQSKVEGAYTSEQFRIDWNKRVVQCPQGITSAAWRDYLDGNGKAYHMVNFPKIECSKCCTRTRCTKAKQSPRRLFLHPQVQHDALYTARQRLNSDTGWKLYSCRAGVEGTLSQAVRAFGLRRTRYCGLTKTHLQNIAIATALNIERVFAWLTNQPRASTRVSPFAKLAT